MKRGLSVLLILCLLAASLSGCAGELPPLPPLPGDGQTDAPADAEATPEGAAETEQPALPELPEDLELGFSLPRAETDEELRYYFSPAEEFDCAFVYPSYCSLWFEKGALRMEPSWFFARMFFTSVLRDDDNAPEQLLDLLEPGKWGSVPHEGTAGTGWPSLRALHLKYDTWRDWVAWETPERYYLLYGSCFDGREEALGSVFEIVAESFRTGAELLASAPESGTLLRRSGELCLFFDGAAISGGSSPAAELRLRAVNGSEKTCALSVSGCTADTRELPFESALSLGAGEEALWTLTLPLLPEEGGEPFASLSLCLRAQGDEGTLFELPAEIQLNR